MRSVSIIVVSHSRTDALDRCLTSLSQLDYRCFEVVVVADGQALDRISARRDADQLKTIRFDRANISEARNLGLEQAAGEIVAFIDDDSVAEPTWLDHLVSAFEDGHVSAAGGYVRGRNGVSFQWRASSADAAGRSWPADLNTTLPQDHVWRTEGTNMAFRREALISIGGFDTAFAFFLDETDVNRRIPGVTRIVPSAEVHHGYAASARRREDRVPRDLFEIGASTHVFLRKHAPAQVEPRLQDLRAEQKARLLRHMIAGRLEPRDVGRLMSGLEDGISEGATRPFECNGQFSIAPTSDFLPYRKGAAGKKVLLTGPWRRRHELWEEARIAARAGERPTVILFAPDTRFLQVRFHSDGVWRHTGGTFGRGLRSEPIVRWSGRKIRVADECARITEQRGQFDS